MRFDCFQTVFLNIFYIATPFSFYLSFYVFNIVYRIHVYTLYTIKQSEYFLHCIPSHSIIPPSNMCHSIVCPEKNVPPKSTGVENATTGILRNNEHIPILNHQ